MPQFAMQSKRVLDFSVQLFHYFTFFVTNFLITRRTRIVSWKIIEEKKNDRRNLIFLYHDDVDIFEQAVVSSALATGLISQRGCFLGLESDAC